MGDMPYSIDKGEAMTYVEDLLNGASDAQAVAFVQTWRGLGVRRKGKLVRTISEQLVHPGTTYATRKQRARREALAARYPGWYRERHYSKARKPLDLHLLDDWYRHDSGFFLGIEGEEEGIVEGIVGEALCRAVEVALGLRVGADGAATRTRGRAHRWPIDMWWACPLPRFDAHVSWRANGATGQVNVLFLTPAIEEGVIFEQLDRDPTEIEEGDPLHARYGLQPEEARNFSADPQLDRPPTYDDALDGPYQDHRRGSWIVSASTTRPKPGESGVVLAGRVTVVSPAYPSGGVRPTER